MSKDFSLTSFPQIETDRLLLREATQEDAEAIFAIFSDPEVTRFHDLETFARIDQAIGVIERRKKGFESGGGIRWGIARKQDDRLIGSCGFTWNQDATAAEIGYELARSCWRQGFMSEALQVILEYGFENRGLQFVIAEIMLGNAASRRLLTKLGFESQGILRNRGFWKGKYHDLEQFRLEKIEFTNKRK